MQNCFLLQLIKQSFAGNFFLKLQTLSKQWHEFGAGVSVYTTNGTQWRVYEICLKKFGCIQNSTATIVEIVKVECYCCSE